MAANYYYLPIQGLLGAAAAMLTMLARNFHHVRRGGKDVYILAWPMRLIFAIFSLAYIGATIYVLTSPKEFTPGMANDMELAAGGILFVGLSWYFVLYRISVDKTAIYYAAFFTTVIPFDSITRIVVKSARRGPDYAYVYSKGHLPIYVSGYLPDYSDLMGSIWDGSPSTVRES